MTDDEDDPIWNPGCAEGALFRRLICVISSDEAYESIATHHLNRTNATKDKLDRAVADSFRMCRGISAGHAGRVIDVIAACVGAGMIATDANANTAAALAAFRYMPGLHEPYVADTTEEADVDPACWLLGVAMGDRSFPELGAIEGRGFDWMADMLVAMLTRMRELDVWRGRNRYRRTWIRNVVYTALGSDDAPDTDDPCAFGVAIADMCGDMVDHGFDDPDAVSAFDEDYRLFLRWSAAVASMPSVPACVSTAAGLCWLFDDINIQCDDGRTASVIVDALESGAEPDYSAFRGWLRGMDDAAFLHPIPLDEDDYDHGVIGIEDVGNMRSPGRVLGALYAYDMMIMADGADPRDPTGKPDRETEGRRGFGYGIDDVRRGLRMLERGMPMDMVVETVLMNGRDRGDGPQ